LITLIICLCTLKQGITTPILGAFSFVKLFN
jgi:hypothetical protein